MSFMKTKLEISAIMIIISLFLTGCQVKKNTEKMEVSFAIIANTMASSPFKPADNRMILLSKELNENNTQFIIHMGNLIFAGPACQSMIRRDVNRQLQEQYSYFSKVSSVIYHVKGPYDIADDYKDLFEKYFKRNGFYSFNYGNSHIIVIDSNEGKVENITEKQMNWLKKDFKKNSYYSNKIVFLRHAVKIPDNKRYYRGIAPLRNIDELLNLFKENDVKAVFSCEGSSFFEFEEEGIHYVNAAISPLDEYTSRREADYYIVNISGEDFKITPHKLKR